MTSDLKTTQKIEQERLALLEQLLKERFGVATRESAESIQSNK